jgi:VWFA-related protein
VLLALTATAQQPPPDGLVKFEVTSNLVVVNVSVKDKSGKPVLGLKREDFLLFEDDKRQNVGVFEFQNLNQEKLPPMPPPPVVEEQTIKVEVAKPEKEEKQAYAPGELRYKDRRLLVMFFDLSSMKPEEQIRSQTSALKFIAEQMNASDLVSLMTFSGALKVDVEFTEDRQELVDAIKALPIGEMADFVAPASTGPDVSDASSEEDEGKTLFIADDSEFNVFNTDRKLSALESATKFLAAMPEKKALVYFSAGVGKTGIENQAQLRATINWAIKANVAFYPVDARGLVASAPAGDASAASLRGTAIYSGQVQRQNQMKHIDAQETLYSLAAETGGKALLDNNDLSMGIVQAQQDINSYYILGFYSTNGAEDGKFRKIKVRLANNQQAKLEYRAGYFANKVWKDFNSADKERQLEEALQLATPKTEIPMALEVNYFRLGAKSYFVPVAVKVPGSVLGMAKKGKDQISEIDFIGQVRDSKGKTVASVRDTLRVKLNETAAAEWNKKPIEYDTGFAIAPGKYKIKFLTRENQTGKIGTFESKFEIPDLNARWSNVRISTIVWGNQRVPLTEALASAANEKKLMAMHPLVQESQKLLPSITHVFRKNQNLYVYFEVYDPRVEDDNQPSVAATLTLYRGATKAYESAPVRITQLAESRTKTVPFQFQLPLKDLGPGEYTCQLNVVDEVGGKFAFPRAPIVLLP